MFLNIYILYIHVFSYCSLPTPALGKH